MRRLRNWQLMALCVLAWGTTWHAITYQIGHTPAEVGVALRFALAGALVLATCAWRGIGRRFSAREHARLALQGTFLYGVSYVCVYQAERHLASGLVAVGYSASPLVTGLGAFALFKVPVSRRFLVGGALGLVGVALIFWPEFGRAVAEGSTVAGAWFTVASVLLSAIGSLVASRNKVHGLPFWPALGLGMLYGAAAAAVVALVQGHNFALPRVASWWASLLYLALVGSVLAFACFLTLQERIGPGPTGSVGVLTPLLALAVSFAFEGFRPDMLTAVGATLAVSGNVLMLSRPTAAARRLRVGAAAAE